MPAGETRKSRVGRFEVLTEEAADRMIEIRTSIARETGVYRRQFRVPKR